MEKTMKQIAEGLGVDKQRVYRFIVRNNITASRQLNQTRYYDETAQTLIESGFKRPTESEKRFTRSTEPNPETVAPGVVESLFRELEAKNQQIAEKDKQIAALLGDLERVTSALTEAQNVAKAAQALHAGTLQAALEAGAGSETDTAPTSPEPGQSDEDIPPQKKGFLARLLGL